MRKFNNKKLNWYGNLGNIKFNLVNDNVNIKINCSPIQFTIIEFIINYLPMFNNKKSDLINELKKYLNIFTIDLENEIKILLDNNLINIIKKRKILNIVT